MTQLSFSTLDHRNKEKQPSGIGSWANRTRSCRGRRLSSRQIRLNWLQGAICAKVEHVFRVIKYQFGYHKVRYRGIEKNGAQVFALLAQASLFLARRRRR
jgi:IS5 family transposase